MCGHEKFNVHRTLSLPLEVSSLAKSTASGQLGLMANPVQILQALLGGVALIVMAAFAPLIGAVVGAGCGVFLAVAIIYRLFHIIRTPSHAPRARPAPTAPWGPR